jgi:hypothetical protein
VLQSVRSHAQHRAELSLYPRGVRVRRELSRLWRQHRLGFLALLAIGALALGFVGYLQADASLLNAIYGTLSLLAFNFYKPPSGDIPPTLQIARFMAPGVAAFATLTALTALLGDQWDLVRARLRRDHVVVCGLGRRGTRLVRSLRSGASPVSVVAVEADHANPNVEMARRLDALVVIGDPADNDVLHAAGVQRASCLIAVLPDDADNAAVASVARGLCASRPDSLSAFCHIADMDLVEDLTSVAVGTATGGLALEWFSVPERAARLLLSEHAGLVSASVGGGPPHLVVVGTDDLARAIVVNAARQWCVVAGPNAEPVRITVAWEGARAWLEQLADRHPSVARAARLESYEYDLRAVAHSGAASSALGDATAVFVCAPSDTRSLELGFAISRVLSGGQTVVVRLLIENAGFVELLEPQRGSGSIQLFSVIDRACSVEMVTDGLNEALARALHAVYLRQSAGASDEESGRPMVPFEQLDETFKGANRAQARDLASKLHDIGCRIRPLTDWDAPLLELEPDEVETLAELEHERWNIERKENGWLPGAQTDRARRINRWIDVPWNDLADEIARYDRAFVEALPSAVAAAGYEIYRATATPTGIRGHSMRGAPLREMNEVLARARHEDYVRAEVAKGITREENPSLVPWEHLTDSLKDSNRRFADGIAAKLSAMGCVLDRVGSSGRTTGDGTGSFAFSGEEIEQLAELEHQRWLDDLLADSWRPTEGNKNPDEKLHPLLKQWSELSEDEREKDRDAVRELPRMLERAGYRVHRV